ncbi:3D-(3,5/4)-trihydroxycyclohexane-1,2-dione acylhydrolase (decyclizing) [Plantibacter sp. YIM 135249]|uniref:3D-(3,5/4)-trihydroxycyclohexane-1,2-dione acylhydrolase (decyclizing) n=1 Tax=Plantibacter sp. YIM 135249 TaxID=3423918 RepID=UPI003D3317CC
MTTTPSNQPAATTRSETVRLTVSQAIVRFLSQQFTLRDGVEHRVIEGVFGIFGHGNVAGLGQALLEAELDDPTTMPYYLARNEQGAVHAASGFAKQRNRLSTLAVTTSVGPGATNMITGAALATVNRIPVLLLPADTFASRAPDPVLQQLERSESQDVTVNDAFRPVSAFFDRVWRAEQLPLSLLNAMRVLTDPAQTGAVTIALPEDVQAEAHDWPVEFFRKRVWTVARTRADIDSVRAAADLIAQAKRPFIVAGGGVQYSEANAALAELSERWGIPVGQTHAGKGSLPAGHPMDLGGVGSTGTIAANALASTADLVIGIGTRYSDFTTSSKALFQRDDVRFLNLNVAGLDAIKLAGHAVVGDARESLVELGALLAGHTTGDAYLAEITAAREAWEATRAAAIAAAAPAASPDGISLPAQIGLLGILNEELADEDVIVNAAGSAPGDLHRLWQPRSAKQYHVEYGFSTMGYEIAGALGVKMAAPERQVVALVGDGSYLMLSQEIVTAVAERTKLVIVLIDNQGFASIGNLSESVGSQRFGTKYRYRNVDTSRLDGGILPVDLAANVRSLGAHVIEANGLDEFRSAVREALAAEETTAVYVRSDPTAPGVDGGWWWDVPVAEVSQIESTAAARAQYEIDRLAQRPHL